MRKSIDELLASYHFFLDVEVQLQARYQDKKIITGISAPDKLKRWCTVIDLFFPQQIYVSELEIPVELRNNAILDITGKLRENKDGLFYFEATDSV
ncbi:MAG: hypothetical protein A2161_21040 [Candidatus Schekmanbacteria bacterium RBG_13_48_7]|uniref:Uncharacterized protein n=1 Tax=Candidatus Schekmanbacteria bacterium RBG_13_48_7 TaxID=1817878 RepID=A0A1F7RR04_9BACT|nr:MAG: hypothetical protein A2161_21040 [Candidatus Schekmanbacteria bacterium RBG_13_48_7]